VAVVALADLEGEALEAEAPGEAGS